MKTLSERQRKSLFAEAQKAWRVAAPTGAFGSFDEFRRSVLEEQTGKASFGELSNEEYGRMADAFARYCGQTARTGRVQYTPHQKAVHFLKDAMQRFELPMAYLAEIMRDKFGLTLEPGWTLDEACATLSHRQVWTMVYTVNNRGRAAVRRTTEQLGVEYPVEYHASKGSMPPGGLCEHFNIRKGGAQQ